MKLFLSLILTARHITGEESSKLMQSVQVGGCFDYVENEFVGCAVFDDKCYDPSGRIKYRKAKDFSFDDPKCPADKVPIGYCGAGTVRERCAFGEDSCENGEKFTEGGSYGRCSAEGIFFNTGFVPTQYGGCRNTETQHIVCALTRNDCIRENEEWLLPSTVEKLLEGGCQCHDVVTGMCKKRDLYGFDLEVDRCAMKETECSYNQEFFSARQVLQNRDMDCRFCAYNAALTSGIEKSQYQPDVIGAASPETNNAAKPEKYNNEEVKIVETEVAGVVIATVIASMFVILIGFVLYASHIEKFRDGVVFDKLNQRNVNEPRSISLPELPEVS